MARLQDSVLVRAMYRFDASAERVYDAFLDPSRAGKFLFAPATGRIVRCEIDARVGGIFTIAIAAMRQTSVAKRRVSDEVAG